MSPISVRFYEMRVFIASLVGFALCSVLALMGILPAVDGLGIPEPLLIGGLAALQIGALFGLLFRWVIPRAELSVEAAGIRLRLARDSRIYGAGPLLEWGRVVNAAETVDRARYFTVSLRAPARFYCFFLNDPDAAKPPPAQWVAAVDAVRSRIAAENARRAVPIAAMTMYERPWAKRAAIAVLVVLAAAAALWLFAPPEIAADPETRSELGLSVLALSAIGLPFVVATWLARRHAGGRREGN